MCVDIEIKRCVVFVIFEKKNIKMSVILLKIFCQRNRSDIYSTVANSKRKTTNFSKSNDTLLDFFEVHSSAAEIQKWNFSSAGKTGVNHRQTFEESNGNRHVLPTRPFYLSSNPPWNSTQASQTSTKCAGRVCVWRLENLRAFYREKLMLIRIAI